MNIYEREMLKILKVGKKKYGFVGVKAEFEAEGTRSDEFLRLLEITRRADLDVALKIGGGEAIRDLMEAKQYGVDYIIAPMLETPYAVKKYIEACEKVYSKDEFIDTDFLFNLETITSYNNVEEILSIASASKIIKGIVFGRVDFSLSQGLSRADINSNKIETFCCDVAQKCKDNKLQLVVGGGVSIDGLTGLINIKNVHLDRFETRKIVFDASCLTQKDSHQGILHAVKFELLWLKNKHQYYANIAEEDNMRIAMLQARWDEAKLELAMS
ncbi:MAG: aldolase/citrate lyase family protein [Pseudomonadota bacterium]